MRKVCVFCWAILFIPSSVAIAEDLVPSPGGPAPLTLPMPKLVPDSTLGAPAPVLSGAWGGHSSGCGHFWSDAEFLLWRTKNVPVTTPLVTQATNAADPTSGALGSANTRILLGGQSYGLDTRYGGRFTVGTWFDDDHILGAECNYLFIANQSTTRSVSSDGSANSPILAFPFRDVTTGKESALQFTAPGIFSGGASLRLRDQIQGGEINLLGTVVRTDTLRLMGLAGFRYINFTENLDLAQGNVGVPGGVAAGQAFDTFDHFHAANNFYGGQLGLRSQYQLGKFVIEGTGKVALGFTNQSVNVGGTTNAVFPDGTKLVNVTGGTFALGSNSGNHSRSPFGVVPEADLKVGYNVTSRIQCFVGYTFLYLNNVARPGTMIDHNLNTSQSPAFGGSASQLVGTPAPAFSVNRSDFWAQGVNFGVQFKF
jgi:putative beta barrel porin BBP7